MEEKELKLWIARDKNGELWAYTSVPRLDKGWGKYFQPTDGESFCIDEKLYPDITFENSPVEVYLKIEEK